MDTEAAVHANATSVKTGINEHGFPMSSSAAGSMHNTADEGALAPSLHSP